jgi:hypothetical protein
VEIGGVSQDDVSTCQDDGYTDNEDCEKPWYPCAGMAIWTTTVYGLFGCLPKTPHHATHFPPQVWRPNRPPYLRRGVAPEFKEIASEICKEQGKSFKYFKSLLVV